MGTDVRSQVKNNGVDPQDLIDVRRRHRAPVHHVHRPPEATLEWNDAAGGSYRFLRRVWNFGVRWSRIAAPPHAASTRPAGRMNGKLEPGALRLRCHTLKQVDYDYQRLQPSTTPWWSGAMKMLNALEGFKGRRAG